MAVERELTYTKRERTFVAWSCILGYAFDFYNLIVLAFLLVPIQTRSISRCRRPGSSWERRSRLRCWAVCCSGSPLFARHLYEAWMGLANLSEGAENGPRDDLPCPNVQRWKGPPHKRRCADPMSISGSRAQNGGEAGTDQSGSGGLRCIRRQGLGGLRRGAHHHLQVGKVAAAL